jgi:8-oxo-dGTP pyrophosphatase MutT (NUDIX family)
MSPYVRNLRAKVGHDLLMFPTVSAVVLNGDAILLGQRADNHAWMLPAGMVDPGEQPADAIVREVLEETGVHIAVDRLAGVALHEVTYPNGDLCHMFNTWFRCRPVGGVARVNDEESAAVGWFRLDALPPLSAYVTRSIEIARTDDPAAWFAAPGEEQLLPGW